MEAGNGLGNGQAQTVAFGRAGRVGLKAPEPVEQKRQKFRRDARPRVLHPQRVGTAGSRPAHHPDAAAFVVVLDGVGEQVTQQRVQQAGVGAGAHVVAGQVHGQADVALLAAVVQFLGHELLTPASILQSRFENMLQDPTLPETHALQIVESQRTLYRLRNTVRTLLLIANIENEQYLRNEPVRLSAAVADVAEELDDRRQQRDIALRVDLSGNDELPLANASLLHTLLRNLLSNAIKYNRTGGQIRVVGHAPAAGGYTLRVEDTGPGIAPENLPYLFDRFRRFHGNAPGAPEGYGLGLPIAQTIAHFHHATLRAESEPGQGTAFILDFRPATPLPGGFMPAS